VFAAASRREFDVLLLWSLDRLSREGMVETLNHLQRLTGYGVTIGRSPSSTLTRQASSKRPLSAFWLPYQPSFNSRLYFSMNLSRANFISRKSFQSDLLECSEMTANLDGSARSGFSRSRTAAYLFLTFAAVIEILVTVLAGGPVAQSSGDPRLYGLICCFLAGLLGVLYWVVVRPARFGSHVVSASILVSLYAFCQVIPLPLRLVRLLSPARAKLAEALRPITHTVSWVPISVVPSATLYHGLLFLACTSVFLVIYDLSKRFSYRPWAVALPLIFAGAAQAIIGLLQEAAVPDNIATGTFMIRNHYAGFLAMILPFAAAIPFCVLPNHERGRDSPRLNQTASTFLALCGLAVSALLAAAIISSVSRMGFVAALTSIVFVAIVGLNHTLSRSNRRLMAASVVVVTLFLVAAFPSARLVSRFADLEEYGNDRWPAWRDTFKVIETYPVFGCGLGGYESAFLEFKNSAPALTQDYVHNDYLQYLAEMGAVGFAVAFFPLATIIFRLRWGLRQFRPDLWALALACAGSLLAIGLHSFADFNLYVPANMFTLAWILGISAYVGERGLLDGKTGRLIRSDKGKISEPHRPVYLVVEAHGGLAANNDADEVRSRLDPEGNLNIMPIRGPF
jgi:putative inorganic carbon (hco3(-)) transporter